MLIDQWASSESLRFTERGRARCMPSRKAADRSPEFRNERSDQWIKTPYWTPDTEAEFEAWVSPSHVSDPWALVSTYLASGISVSLREFKGAYCVTLSNSARREAGLACLLSGWSDTPGDALLVVTFRLFVQMAGDWAAELSEGMRSRRR